MEPLDAFLEAYWKDRDAGRVQPLAEYLARFPGDDLAIASEFVALEGDKPLAETTPGDSSADLFGPYRLMKSVGRGGQGEVFLAEDTRLGRNVALKLLTNLGPVNDTLATRFRREAEVASRLQHAGICTVYEAGEIDGTLFIAMQYVEGETLRDHITRARQLRADGAIKLDRDALTTEDDDSNSTRSDVLQVVRLFERIARAAHVAHDHGILHRDLKPGNIIVTPHDDPVILDFGLAREIAEDQHNLTMTGDFFGTPAYMAPEQLREERTKPSPRSDVYALGVTLYECLTLTRPFDGATREALFHDILHGTPTDARRRNPLISGDLHTVLSIALEKDADHRYATAEDLAEDLRLITERKPIRGRPVGAFVRLRRWAQRNPALTITLIGLTAALAIALWQLAQKNAALDEARSERDRNTGYTLAIQSRSVIPVNPGLGLALGVTAYRRAPNPFASSVLHEALRELREVGTMRHEGPISYAGFSPDGRRVLTRDRTHTFVWDAATGKPLEEREGRHAFEPAGGLTTLAADPAPSGKIQQRDGDFVYVEALGSGTVLSLPWDGGKISTVAVSEGHVALATEDGNVTVLLHPSRSERVDRRPIILRGHTAAVQRMRFNSTGTRLVTASADSTVRIWRIDTGLFEPRSVAEADPDRPEANTSRDGRVLTYTDVDGEVVILDAHAGSIVKVAEKHAATFASGDGESVIILASKRLRLQCRRVDGTADPSAVRDATIPIVCANADRERDVLITGHGDGTVAAQRLSDGEELWSERKHRAPVTAIVFGPAGEVATASDDRTARIWDERSGAERAVLAGHADIVWPLAYDRARRRWITASRNIVRTWRPNGALENRFEGAGDEIVDAFLSPDGRRIATVATDRTAIVWDAVSGRRERQFEIGGVGHARGVGFDRSGGRIAFRAGNGVWLYDAQTGERLATLDASNLISAHCTTIEGEDIIVTMTNDGTLRRWAVDVFSAATKRARPILARERTRFGLAQ